MSELAGGQCLNLRFDATSPGEVAEPSSRWYTTAKYYIDFVLATLMLIPAIPVMLAAMALVKLTSNGPAIYSQTRLGRGGKPFTIFKIRTMSHDCERHTGARWAAVGDPRVTPIGRFLRMSHLDELPQLWNVLRGDMSLVGPRPERPEFASQLEKVIPHYGDRILVRPGLTGLAQVQLPPDVDVDSVKNKLACDLHYIEWCGLFLDLQILLSTVTGILGIPFNVSRRLLRTPYLGPFDTDLPPSKDRSAAEVRAV